MWEFCLTLRLRLFAFFFFKAFCIVLVFSVLDAITQQLGTAAVTQYTFAQAVQKWLRYAPDRAGGSGRRDVM